MNTVYRIGHQLIDEFLEFVVGRARPNTVRAYAHDLSVFFSVVKKEPTEVRPKDVMAFVTAQRRPKPGAENVVRIADGSAGLSAATIKRRLAAISSFYGYLITRDDVDVSTNPVPRGIATRQSRSRGGRGLPLVRGVRRLPRILDPDEIDALMGALRTERDRAMTQAMVLGGLRRCEVLGLRLGDLRLGEWRVLIREGKGGYERLVPLSPTFFSTVARYMDHERPQTSSDALFVVLKGERRGQPLSVPGLDRIIAAAPSGPVCPTAPATSCATPASRGCARRAWPSKPSRPKPDTARSPRRGSISTSASTGLTTSTAGPPKPSRPRRSWGRPDERARPSTSRTTASRRRDARGHVGPDRHAGTGHGDHHGLLPGSTRSIGPTEHGGGRRGDAAALRPSAHPGRSGLCVGGALGRSHIEDFKTWLAARPGKKGKGLATITIRHRLSTVRTFFERIMEWDYDDAPARLFIYMSDFPALDEPLPKFLDDPTAAKFMAALAEDPNLRRRLMVELLARTGIRVGELSGLEDDAMVRKGDGHRLRIPIGKLHNDRYVPLLPMLVDLIGDYKTLRGSSRSGRLLERDDGRPFDRRTVHRYVVAVAKRAGVGHVHPHQLRHTLATQSINRGMSLEAIAALLGHRSMDMTLTYARISDETVADAYFKVTEAVEAQYYGFSGAARPRTASSTRAPTVSDHRRLLANGHCTRPALLDCAFESVCERCGFFEAGPQFLTILKSQRKHADERGQSDRTDLFDGLIEGVADAQ